MMSNTAINAIPKPIPNFAEVLGGGSPKKFMVNLE